MSFLLVLSVSIAKLITCRISIENLKVEIRSLEEKMLNIKLQLKKQKEEDEDFFHTIQNFLNDSDRCIKRMKEETDNDLELLRQKVAKFFCEDTATFKLEECLRIFVIFEQRFKVAIEDNRKRLEHQQKAKTRQMNSTALPSKGTKENSQMSNTCQVNSQLIVPTESLKVMSRSLESSANGNSTIERTSSFNRRRSRPNSQDVTDLHSNLVEFLTNPSNLETPNIDGNLYGSNFRRVGSGRRSLRSLNNNTAASTIPEDSRERIAGGEEPKQNSAEEHEENSSKFNRFSPLRRTMNYKSTSRDNEANCSKPKVVENTSTDIIQGNETIPRIKVSLETNQPKNMSNENEVTESLPTRTIEAPKQLPVISSLRKSNNQYIQQLTAIISPTKFIESNDALHQQFESSNSSTSGPATDFNIIVSTVATARPSSLPNALPPIAVRRTPSFVLGSDGKATTPVNAAIVMPMQKMVYSEATLSTDSEAQQINKSENGLDSTTEKKSKLERKSSQLKTVSSSRDSPSQKIGSSKSSVPVSGKGSTPSVRTKASSSISFRQQSAVDKRIAWVMSTRNGHSLQPNTARRPPAPNGKYYRTPSTVSRTGLNSDMGSMLSLQRSSLMGTLSSSKSLDSSGSGIPQPGAKSFMKPTSASSAKTRM